MKSGQKGFTIIEALLALILLAIIGFTGYYVYHSQKNTDNSYNNAVKSNSSTPATTEPAGQKFIFKELGVQIDLPPVLKDMSYTVSNINGVQYLDLTSPQFVNALKECNPGADVSGAVFSSLDRKSGTYPSKPDVLNGDGQLLKQFDGFYVEDQFPNGISCGDVSKGDSLTKTLSSYKEALGQAFKTATEVK